MTCLTVVDDRAALARTITAATNPTSGLQVGDTLSFALQDNRPPSADPPEVIGAKAENETCDVDAYLHGPPDRQRQHLGRQR